MLEGPIAREEQAGSGLNEGKARRRIERGGPPAAPLPPPRRVIGTRASRPLVSRVRSGDRPVDAQPRVRPHCRCR